LDGDVMKNKKNKKLLETLYQALSICDQSNDMSETRLNIKKAINNIEEKSKRNEKKEYSNPWWNSVQSGVANMAFSNISQECQMKSLKNLESMISDENKKLDEIDVELKNNNSNNFLFE
jgi:hypothetical protein